MSTRRERFRVTRWAICGAIALATAIWIVSACADATTPQETLPEETAVAIGQPSQATVTPTSEPSTQRSVPAAQATQTTVAARPSPPTASTSPALGPQQTTPGLPARIVVDQSDRPDRDLAELAVRLRGVEIDDSPLKIAPPMSRGAQQEFWITNLDDGTARSITATLQLVKRKCLLVRGRDPGRRPGEPGPSRPTL